MDIVAIKDLPDEKEYAITIPAASLIQAVDGEILERAKTFKLAGFREGNVPISIVRGQIGAKILNTQISSRIGSCIQSLVAEKKIIPMGEPAVEVTEFNPETNLKFTIKFKVLPPIPEIDWHSRQFKEIEVLTIDVSDEDVKKARDLISKASADFTVQPDDYKAQVGDAVIVDFVGQIDGQDFEGNRATELRIVIGDGQFISSLEDQLVSLKKEDEKQINVTFPENYHSTELASKSAVFNVKIHSVLKRQLGEQSDDLLVQNLGGKRGDNLDELLKKKLEIDFSTITRMKTKKELFDAIDAVCSVDIPEQMVTTDYEAMLKDAEASAEQKGQGKLSDDTKEGLRQSARRRVKLGLILSNVARNGEITVGDENVQELQDREIRNRPSEEKEIRNFFGRPENLDRAKASIIEEKIVDIILGKIPSIKKTLSVAEFNDMLSKEQKAN